MVTAVTPQAGTVTTVTTGGTAIIAAQPPFNGCYITNPVTAAEQGIATAENLYVDPTGAGAILNGRGFTVSLAPGQSWSGIPGSTLPISVNAATSGHRFTCVRW